MQREVIHIVATAILIHKYVPYCRHDRSVQHRIDTDILPLIEQQNKLQSAFQSDVKELEVRKQQLLRKKENLKQHLFAIKGEAKANLAGQQPLPVPSDQ